MKVISILIISIEQIICSRIGALGLLTFRKTMMPGSAQANIETKVARHKRKEKYLFWRIDHLLSNEEARVFGSYYMKGENKGMSSC
jgi:Uri superfamily endonuclease